MLQAINNLEFVCVLSESTSTKQCHLLYKSKDCEFTALASVQIISWCSAFLSQHPNGLSIISCEKTAFNLPTQQPLPLNDTNCTEIASNDIYLRYLKTSIDAQKLNIIHPCTLTHISKYISSPSFLIAETASDYINMTKPWIDAIPASRTLWIESILDGRKEQEDIIFSDPNPSSGFILVPVLVFNTRTQSGIEQQSQIYTCWQLCGHSSPVFAN